MKRPEQNNKSEKCTINKKRQEVLEISKSKSIRIWNIHFRPVIMEMAWKLRRGSENIRLYTGTEKKRKLSVPQTSPIFLCNEVAESESNIIIYYNFPSPS